MATARAVEASSERAMSVPMNATELERDEVLERGLRVVWERHRDGLFESIEVIERTIATLGTNAFDELREEARRSAHMLSGSLGVFGFGQASEAAHELQLQLSQTPHAVVPGSALAGLVAIVRDGLDAESERQRKQGSQR
jgi:HPt (histidine-containing phosphotransfer) domain-containing protein